MKKFHFSHLLAVALLALSFTFTSCDLINNLSKTNTVNCYYSLAPIGTWKASQYEQYTITTTTFSSLNSYEGNNLVIVPLSDTAGTIFVKYTKSYESTTTEPTDSSSWLSYTYNGTTTWYRYSTTAPDVGKWYAISYKNLTSSSVQLSGAAKTGGVTSTSTLEQAISEFTIENGYFSYYSECAKQ